MTQLSSIRDIVADALRAGNVSHLSDEPNLELRKKFARQYSLLTSQSLLGVDSRSYGFSIQDLLDHNKIDLAARFSGKNVNLSGLRLDSLEGLCNIPNIENAETLYIRDNRLSSITPEVFSGVANLKCLVLSGNPAGDKFDYRYITIMRGAFSSLTHLEELHLCDITAINAETFIGLTNLKALSISKSLRKIEQNTFNNLPSLQRLEFNDNELESIAPGAFSGLANLQYLDLGRNCCSQIKTTIVPGTFSGLANLKVLHASATNVAAGVFSGLAHLEELYLYGVAAIHKEAFTGLTNLKVLNVGGENLKTIEQYAFSSLINLQELDLSYSRLTAVGPETFSGLTNLTSLNLSYNRIKTIAPEALSGLTNLEYLNFHMNLLIAIEPETFRSLTNLKSLSLSSNKFSCIDPETFRSLVNLQDLHLDIDTFTQKNEEQINEVFAGRDIWIE